MSKVYKVGDVFYDKWLKCHVKAVDGDFEHCDRDNCALYSHSKSCGDVARCMGMRFVKVAVPKCSIEFCPESSWGINPTKATLETVMAKGERIANSIMGNSTELSFAHDKELNARETFLKIAKEHREYRRKLELNESRRFIVSLLENGILQPSATPKIHNTIESAEMEAERLCKLHEREFVVLKVTASFKPQAPKREVFA